MVYAFNFSYRVYSQNSRVMYVCAAWITVEWLSVFGMNLLRVREKSQMYEIKKHYSMESAFELFLFACCYA